MTKTPQEQAKINERMAKARAARKVNEAPKEKKLENMTQEQKILYHYQHGEGSIQNIARFFNVEVDEVLNIIGEGDIAQVHQAGDTIGPDEAGPNATINYGEDVKVPFTLN